MNKVNQSTYAIALRELLDGPVTAHEIAKETGLHIVTAQSLMRTLKKHRVVHVAAWEPNSRGQDITPVYALGDGRDKPRRKMTPAERQKACRLKKSALQTVNMIFQAHIGEQA